jgi:MFS superfamily sulfate permease-like transporter
MDDRPSPAPSSSEAAYGETSPFEPARRERLLTRAIPVARHLPRYRAPSARRDLLAGVTVAALAVPSAMALRADGVTLVVAHLRTRMEEQFELAGVTETIGRERFYPTVHAAVEKCVGADEAATDRA